ncbi:hypothetical protein ACHAW5_009081 [Stephanodiscus triporus]|uniref:DNA 3'-5' helicase n=1 Tax=Stephanodiscus triporus TaxID=2934178 RepID=A0ABD3QIX4_9STRA
MIRATVAVMAVLVLSSPSVSGVRAGAGIMLPDLTTAFQMPSFCVRRNAPPAYRRLGYSSDRLSVGFDSEDRRFPPTRENFDITIVHDRAIESTNGRRIRRLRSLENFNRANQTSSSSEVVSGKDGIIVGKRETASPREEDATAKFPLHRDNRLELELPYNDPSQLQAIKSNAPAILLPSGPGTGKSRVLSLRIAYLLQRHITMRKSGNIDAAMNGGVVCSDDCTPESMVILSFTNRDAERLKQRALDFLFCPQQSRDVVVDPDKTQQIRMRGETSRKLWAGTMHAFSFSILEKYGGSPLRVLPAREMYNRVSASLRSLLRSDIRGDGEDKVGGDNSLPNYAKIRKLRSRNLRALNDTGNSRSILFQNIVRCIDLWKEANVPLTFPEAALKASSMEGEAGRNSRNLEEFCVRKSCLELAIRLGIPKSSALLALEIYPEYQARHAVACTADPSDLAGMACRLLIERPDSLRLLRSKLKHIIVDEYQDMSVSQHNLLRLVVRGVVDEDDQAATTTGTDGTMHNKKRVRDQRRRRRLPVLLEPSEAASSLRNSNTLHQGYSVPTIFCAGDANQSIYGWRGGAPELTVHGFLRDFPQGIIAPLEVCYRLPNDIVEAAGMLLPMGFGGRGEDSGNAHSPETYKISPAAAVKLASSVRYSPPSSINDDSSRIFADNHIRLGNQLLLSKGVQKIEGTVIIHGVWDSREEAKYIASTIRLRSRERKSALITALRNFDDEVSFPTEKELQDLTDVAVMVRSSNQLHLLEEALNNAGIPFITDKKKEMGARPMEDGNSRSWLAQKQVGTAKTLQMNPVFLSTLHKSKGEEFDDVYLAGWTEGEFPHPDAISSNRVHEERRLAYVALTRARQRVVITHSFVKRVLTYGKDGRKKHVTGQVQPSRFLYELKPSYRIKDGTATSTGKSSGLTWLPSSDNEGTVWDRSPGIKEYVAGQNLPHSFRKAYQVPMGYVAKRSDLRRLSTVKFTPIASSGGPRAQKNVLGQTHIEIIEAGLRDIIVLGKKGSSKKFSSIFKEMLASCFQIRRGNALVFKSGAKSKQTQNESVYALVEASVDDLMMRPLGKCSATQLGHYLAYLMIKSTSNSASEELKLASGDTRKISHKMESYSRKESLDLIENGLRDIIVLGKKGASKEYLPIFKDMLSSLFQIRRGNALVIKSGSARNEYQRRQAESVYALIKASADDLVKRPLGRCTATQLGHYLAYLILTNAPNM